MRLKPQYRPGAHDARALCAGGAANVLIGGSKHTVALQPISASGIIGTGAALDVEEFELR